MQNVSPQALINKMNMDELTARLQELKNIMAKERLKKFMEYYF
jgi:ribosomal protein L29